MVQPVEINPSKNRRTALISAAVVAGMVGMAYASVPLYKLFCAKTGFGGTTQRADKAPITASTDLITVRFDANTAPSLPWRFAPAQQTMTVKLGEQSMAFYDATNLSKETVTGSAAFNVSPPEAGIYFTKIQCFCFNEQALKAGEHANMPVVFFVDPAIKQDADAKSITEITLSYTFYPAEQKSASLKSN